MWRACSEAERFHGVEYGAGCACNRRLLHKSHALLTTIVSADTSTRGKRPSEQWIESGREERERSARHCSAQPKIRSLLFARTASRWRVYCKIVTVHVTLLRLYTTCLFAWTRRMLIKIFRDQPACCLCCRCRLFSSRCRNGTRYRITCIAFVYRMNYILLTSWNSKRVFLPENIENLKLLNN